MYIYTSICIYIYAHPYTVFNAKRFFGGDLNDTATQIYANTHPYRVVTSNISKHTSLDMGKRMYLCMHIYACICAYTYMYICIYMRIHIE
jgi:hypothetical protein